MQPEPEEGIATRSLQHNTCNRPSRLGPAIKIKGEKMAILYSREADKKSTLVLRDAASTYITTYSQVISTEEGVWQKSLQLTHIAKTFWSIKAKHDYHDEKE